MKRREFIAGLGSAAAWPLTARAQQGDRIRRIGVLMPYDENDPFAKLQLSTLTQALADLGWADGRTVRMDFRWAGGDINRIRAGEQRNKDTHRVHPPWCDGTVPPRSEGYLANALPVDESG
jgi:hypothetical protein